MDPVDTLKKIFEIGEFIYERTQTVKANKSQSMRLYERVKIILDACQGLKKATNIERYQAGLEAVEATFNEILLFISKFDEKNWFKQFLAANSHKDKFSELAEKLWNDVQMLQLGIGAQQIINRDEDKVDISKDMIELQACQEEILRLNREQSVQLLQIHFDQTEQRKLIEKQLDSIREQIAYATGQKKPEKPLLDPKLTTPFYQLEFDEKLAEGSFATVYKGRWLRTPVAIKLIDRALSDVDLKQFSREVDIMSRLRHPNIVQLYSACLEQGRACIVMEFMPQQHLRKMLDAGVQLITKEKNQLALAICQGLLYLHQYGVLHRDLRSNNVLLSQNYQVAKLSDFGFAKISVLSVQSAIGNKPVWQYLAPELMQRDGEASAQSDIYSLGIVLWELYTGKKPYEESSLQPKDILMGKREKIPATVPPTVAALIQRCWATKPFERPSLDELIDVLEAALLQQQTNPEADRLYTQAQLAEQSSDHINAFSLYSEADKLGHVKAKTNKAFYLLTGKGGVVIDKTLAHSEMLIAAQAGHDRAQFNLGQMLEYGDGVQKNLKEALYYYDMAARQHYPKAQANRDKLKAKLESQVTESVSDTSLSITTGV